MIRSWVCSLIILAFLSGCSGSNHNEAQAAGGVTTDQLAGTWDVVLGDISTNSWGTFSLAADGTVDWNLTVREPRAQADFSAAFYAQAMTGQLNMVPDAREGTIAFQSSPEAVDFLGGRETCGEHPSQREARSTATWWMHDLPLPQEINIVFLVKFSPDLKHALLVDITDVISYHSAASGAAIRR